jgi:hypothetical protein
MAERYFTLRRGRFAVILWQDRYEIGVRLRRFDSGWGIILNAGPVELRIKP